MSEKFDEKPLPAPPPEKQQLDPELQEFIQQIVAPLDTMSRTDQRQQPFDTTGHTDQRQQPPDTTGHTDQIQQPPNTKRKPTLTKSFSASDYYNPTSDELTQSIPSLDITNAS